MTSRTSRPHRRSATKGRCPSGNSKGHSGRCDNQNGGRRREHRHRGRELGQQPGSTGSKGGLSGGHDRHCGSWIDRHGRLSSTRMRKKRTLAVRFAEPSGLLAYSAAPARNAAMSMMKPVDNHTTSMGMMEIMGSRTGRFTRNDSVQPISVANTWDGSFLLESNEQKLRPGHRSIVKAEHGGDPETMLPLAVEQG